MTFVAQLRVGARFDAHAKVSQPCEAQEVNHGGEAKRLELKVTHIEGFFYVNVFEKVFLDRKLTIRLEGYNEYFEQLLSLPRVHK